LQAYGFGLRCDSLFARLIGFQAALGFGRSVGASFCFAFLRGALFGGDFALGFFFLFRFHCDHTRFFGSLNGIAGGGFH
jgi:hypothetical protein